MNDQICDAIRAQRLIRFIYDGYERIVEPHIHRINTANHEVLSAYLVGGWSKSAPEAGWRMYLVQDMHDIHVLATPFDTPRPGYNMRDATCRQVYGQLPAGTRGTDNSGHVVTY